MQLRDFRMSRPPAARLLSSATANMLLAELTAQIRWRPRQDSNLRAWLRRPPLYPLSYGGWGTRSGYQPRCPVYPAEAPRSTATAAATPAADRAMSPAAAAARAASRSAR
jgi:hypothetical protein